MIYTVRGVTTVSEWVDAALRDWETSAIEGHLGTWLEEVALVSGGIKPGSGVDLQIERPGPPRITELYAIQAAPNTRAPGAPVQTSSRYDEARRRLERTRGSWSSTSPSSTRASAPAQLRSEHHKAGIRRLLVKITGIPDFRERLLEATTLLASLVTGRAAADVARITAEAAAVYGDAHGNLRLDVLANPPRGR